MSHCTSTEQVYLIFQRYKFKSKSQLDGNLSYIRKGVFDISKIQIQKQITTMSYTIIGIVKVYLIFQRYKFKSKSQPWDTMQTVIQWCIWYFKDTNSKANHNIKEQLNLKPKGVFDISKIQIQKQITTAYRTPFASNPVYLIFQRYKFKSKSQLINLIINSFNRCIWYFKDTNSKANHNQKSNPTITL